MVGGTILHEMVHWSYFKTGVDEEKKYAGRKEYGTTNFELEAFGHPIRLPLSRLCKSKAVPFLGIKWDQQTVYSNTNFDIITVKEVQPDSPAAKAGIKPGNVFRKFDGEGIWPLPQGFSEQLQKKKPGDEVTLEVYQYGTSGVRIIRVTLGAYPVRK